jgi:REP element-mobilizing transposase RayT
MSRSYKFHNKEGAHFVSFSVVKWLKIFNNEFYTEILLDSLRYCQTNKGMEIYAWCIMPDHVHLVFRSVGDRNPELILGDLKRFTSKKIVKAIQENPDEPQKDAYLSIFKKEAAKSSNVNEFQFWQHNNHPIEVYSPRVTFQKINYIHQNPVKAGFVENPEDYKYSSAKDYSGEKGLLDGVVVVK